MDKIKNSWYRSLLCCPDCGSDIVINHNRCICASCDYNFQFENIVSIKPMFPPDIEISFSRLNHLHPSEIIDKLGISLPLITYEGPPAKRDSRQLMSEMSKYLKESSAVLDLGCGPRDQCVPIEYLGHKYVGIDYSNENADFLADAHSIPFKNQSFDCVFSYAVLEHLHNPFVAIREIERVLKPGGIYIGTVSQGEPFHDSYYHLTSWGVISLFSSVKEIKLKKIWWSRDTLDSLSRMGRYPKLIRKLISFIDKIHTTLPFLSPRKMNWTKQNRLLDEMYRAGSICFVVQKNI